LHEQKCLALKVAAERGDKRIVEMLVEAAADVNTDESSLCHTTPTGAAIAGNLGLVDYLIEHGANINIIPTTFRKTPCVWPRGEGGHLEIVERLLQAGADVNVDRSLHEAVGGGHQAVVLRLLDSEAIEDPVPHRYSVDATPLQMAAFGGHIEVLKNLLGANADANATGEGVTVLQAAAERSCRLSASCRRNHVK
jgi:ankyrin repeat protein